MNTTLNIWMLVILGCIVSCDRETIPVKDTAKSQYAYFPLYIGKYVAYQVDSVVYDFAISGGIKADSTTTLVRHVVIDSLREQTGELSWIIERQSRYTTSEPWVIQGADVAQVVDNQLIYTENNQRFLRLIFPMDKRSAWNGTRWIDVNKEIEIAGERMRPYTNWAFEVDSIDISGVAGGMVFDSMLVVTQADDENIIERRFSRVHYAKNVGLVRRVEYILDSQYCNQNPPPTDCQTRPWELKAEKGYIIKQTITDYN